MRICGTLTVVESSTTRAISVRERRLGVRGGGVMKSTDEGVRGGGKTVAFQVLEPRLLRNGLCAHVRACVYYTKADKQTLPQ